MSACVCPAASEERGWAPRPASSRAETRPPSPSAGIRGKRTGAPTRRSSLIAPSSPPQESGSLPRLGSRPGVGPPSGYCTADRGASPALPAAIPSLRLQGKRLSLSGPPGWGQREAPRHCRAGPSLWVKGLPGFCLFVFLSPSTPKGRCVCSRHKCSPGEKQVHSQASGPLFGGGGPAFPPPTLTRHSELAARSLEPKAQPPLDSFLTVPSTPPHPLSFSSKQCWQTGVGRPPLWTPGLL